MDRGEHSRMLLTQPRFSTLRTADQIALRAALEEGIFDQMSIAGIAIVRSRIRSFLDTAGADIIAAINAGRKLDPPLLLRLVELVRSLAAEVSNDTAKPEGAS
jgi:F-type H+-transporting ATPase subunit alpha